MDYDKSMNRQVQPFDVGDMLVMAHEGYSIPSGEVVTIRRIEYVTGTGWCVTVETSKGVHRGYRAIRFNLYKKGNPDMQPFYIIYPAFKRLDGEYHPELNGTPDMFRGTEKELQEYIKTRLKAMPEGTKLLYGLVGKVAEIDAPPIRISSL